MARYKNAAWNLHDYPNGVPIETIHAALLMDLRDELKRLNALLHCANFQAIPGSLNAIRTNTTKRRRRPAKKGARK